MRLFAVILDALGLRWQPPRWQKWLWIVPLILTAIYLMIFMGIWLSSRVWPLELMPVLSEVFPFSLLSNWLLPLALAGEAGERASGSRRFFATPMRPSELPESGRSAPRPGLLSRVEKVGKDTPGTSWFLDLRHKGADPLGFPRSLP